MPIAYNTTSASFSLASNVLEQTVFTFTPIVVNLVKGVWLDTTNLTQTTTIRAYYAIDGTNLRVFQTITWTTGMDDGVLIEGDIPVAASTSFRITLQSGTAEGAVRSVPYMYFTEGLGSGLVQYTYTLTNAATSAAISNAEIFVTTDLAGSNVIASGITNSAGQVVFNLTNNTTFYFWRRHSSHTFVNPDTEVVAV